MGLPLEIRQLAPASRQFAQLLLSRMPRVRQSCSMGPIEGVPALHLLVRVPSPIGPDRDVSLWMERGDEPSLMFGARGWHAHGDHQMRTAPDEYHDESLIDLLDAILGDRFVLFEELREDRTAFESALDLRDPTALLDELTDPSCAQRIRIKSFTGKADREVGLADLDR